MQNNSTGWCGPQAFAEDTALSNCIAGAGGRRPLALLFCRSGGSQTFAALVTNVIDGQEAEFAKLYELHQAAVKEALEEASSFLPLAKAIKADPEIESWLDRNGLDWKYLALP